MKKKDEKLLIKAFKNLTKELALWRETAESFEIHWSSDHWFGHSSYANIKVKMREVSVA